jgi:hypothetical protein
MRRRSMVRTLRHLSLFAAILAFIFGGVLLAGASPSSASEQNALQVLGHGWHRHVYRPWLDTPDWYVEPSKPDVKGFQYRATVKNNTGKSVEGVEWEYLFINPDDGSVVARHQFSSAEKIKAGRVKELVSFSVEPPTKIVEARPDATNDARPQFVEKVSIRLVTYSDGTNQSFE